MHLSISLRMAVLAAPCVFAQAAAVAAPPPTSASAAAAWIRVGPAQQVALGVRVSAVQRASAIRVELPARVSVPASEQALVAAPVAGVVVRIDVGVGERVEAGAPLAEIDSAELAQMQREYAEASNQLALARSQLARDAALFDEGIIARSRLQRARALERDALVLQRQRALALRQAGGGNGLDGKARLRAPRAGVIAQSLVLPGQRVERAAPLLRISGSGALQLDIDASPQQAAGFDAGTPVTVPGWHARGVLRGRAPALGSGQRVLLRARLDEPGQLLPGTQVQALLQRPAPRGTWAVPPTALTDVGGAPVVLVRGAPGFRIVAVTPLARLPDAVLVQGPLRAGDQVASHGVVALKAAAGGPTP